jgi:hypothetical protein
MSVQKMSVAMLLSSLFIIVGIPVVSLLILRNVGKWYSPREIKKKNEPTLFAVGDLVRIKEIKDPMFQTRWDGKVGLISKAYYESHTYHVIFPDVVGAKNFASFTWSDMEKLR